MAHSEAKIESDNETDSDADTTPLERLEEFDGDHDSLCFDGDLAGDRLEMLARHFTTLLDDVKLSVTSDGMFYCESNSGNTALGEVYVTPESWESFDCHSSGTVGVDTRDFYDVARRSGKSTVGVSIGGRTRIGDDSPSLLATNGGTFSGIETLSDPDMIRRTPTMPDFEYPTTATFTDGNQLREFAKAHTSDQCDSTVSVTVSMPTKRDELSEDSDAAVTFETDAEGIGPLVATGDDLEDGVTYTGPINYDGYGVSGDVHSDVTDAHDGNIVVVQCYYTARFFKQALGKLRKTDTKDVPYTVEFTSHTRDSQEYNLLELTRELPGGGHVRFLLAPRINQD